MPRSERLRCSARRCVSCRTHSGPSQVAALGRDSAKSNYWSSSNERWTPQRRARQALLIRSWKPWERSTGPRTTEGKAPSACDAFNGHNTALRPTLRRLAKLLRMAHAIEEIVSPHSSGFIEKSESCR